jgi:hypothetical protein
MNQLLLTSNRVLEGVKSVETIVRPVRLLYFVDPDDANTFLAAVESCCTQWGGSLQIIVPCKSGKRPDATWSLFIERHDPEFYIDLVGVDRDYVDEQERRFQRRTFGWYEHGTTMQWHGVLLPALLQFYADRGEWNVTNRIVNFDVRSGHALSLQLAYRFGHYARRPLVEHDIRSALYSQVRIEQVVKLLDLDPTGMAEESLIDALSGDRVPLHWGEIDPHNDSPDLRFMDLCGIATRSWQHPGQHLPIDDAWRQYGDPYAHRMAIIGSASSVTDACLAWNVRALRPDGNEPLWIDPEWLNRDSVLAGLEVARNANQLGLTPGQPGENWIGLLSASIPFSEVDALAARIPNAVAHTMAELGNLVSNSVKIGYERRTVATFINGRADVALDDTLRTHHFGGGQDFGITVNIPGWKLPPMPEPRFRSSSHIVRSGRDGFTGTLNVYYETLPELVTINARDGYEALEAITKEAGYRVSISDKGRRAIAVLKLLKNPSEMAFFGSSLFVGLVEKMAAGLSPRQTVQDFLRDRVPTEVLAEASREFLDHLQQSVLAEGQFERQHFSWSRIRETLGTSREETDWIIQFLVDRGMLLRGFSIKCPECYLPRWRHIDQVHSHFLCEGCQSSMPLPVNGQQFLEWSYRLNELLAVAYDQGVIPHLQAAWHLTDLNAGSRAAYLGFLPGVDFRSLDDGSNAVLAEADLIAIIDGEVLVAECKRSGHHLTVRDVEKTIELSNQLGATRIVFATTTEFTPDSAPLRRLADGSSKALIELWQHSELCEAVRIERERRLDPDAYLRNLIHWFRSEQH